jgi:leucyl aminopeptidase
MAGMSRDKCGAGAAVGFMVTLAELQPKGLRVVAWVGFVRNSIGADSYVADEIVTSAAGKRVLVVNTDAEGRMLLMDLLAQAKDEIAAVPPAERPPTTVHTIATLTGHALLTVGCGYTIAVDNGPARAAGVAAALKVRRC